MAWEIAKELETVLPSVALLFLKIRTCVLGRDAAVRWDGSHVSVPGKCARSLLSQPFPTEMGGCSLLEPSSSPP